MKLIEAVKLAIIIKATLDKAQKHGGVGSDRGLGMRSAAYDIANDAWYDLLNAGDGSQSVLKCYPSRLAWFEACGFQPIIE